jgi:cell division septation protein DedD
VPQRTAAVAPSRAADANETTSAAGAFSVQLSVATSEETARAQSRALQRKYAGELGGRAPFVRSAEVNGKTVYRVRVGPMSQDDAKELCTKLKGVGGDKTCFIAKN